MRGVVTVELVAMDPEDEDPNDETGLTEDAFLRLSSALSSAGFDIYAGPYH